MSIVHSCFEHGQPASLPSLATYMKALTRCFCPACCASRHTSLKICKESHIQLPCCRNCPCHMRLACERGRLIPTHLTCSAIFLPGGHGAAFDLPNVGAQ